MPSDAPRIADSKAWLEKAAGDIEAAEILSSESPPLGAAVFCQQAVEKAMKGFLAWHDVPFRKAARPGRDWPSMRGDRLLS
jgi:HEPN domain-containing protein